MAMPAGSFAVASCAVVAASLGIGWVARGVLATWPPTTSLPRSLPIVGLEPGGVTPPLVRASVTLDLAPRRVRCWEPDPDAPPRRGLLLYVQNCRVCHEHGLARPIEGLFGATLELQGGGAVVVDEPFIVESILDPPAHVTSGAQPFMPTFRGQLTSHDLRQLVELYRWCRDRPLPAPGAR